MKRCPACKRVENDDTLVFCRADGTALVSDAGSVSGEVGTLKFGSSRVASETDTSILPPAATDADMSRPTAPTTVLPALRISGNTHELIKPKRRRVIIVAAVVIAAALATSAYLYLSRKNRTAIESVVVLPFVNTSGDPNTEYLSDGISEALINSLTELQQLRVIARSTAFRYKGRDVDPQQVGRELNVQTVLMGRVRQVGDVLDVQVDLVDATTGAQLWGAEYERKLSDVLSVKQTIAREVTDKLRLKLSSEDQQRLVRRDTTNAEAYQAYMRGRYYWNKRTAEWTNKAIAEFQQSIDRDPNYALGYVGLADCYLVLEQYAGVPASESLPRARAAADRALQLNDSLAEAHASSALVYQKQWRWDEAEQELKRAISLNPNYATGHQWFAIYSITRRQMDRAVAESKRAQELDPLSPAIGCTLALTSILNQDFDSAIQRAISLNQLDPTFPLAHDVLGLAYLKQHRNEEGIAEFQKAVDLSGRASCFLSDLAYCFAVTGRRPDALALMKELEERYAKHQAIGSEIAEVHIGLGEKDQAFTWLEKDFQQRSGLLPNITWYVFFDDLRSDPRYTSLVRRMGL